MEKLKGFIYNYGVEGMEICIGHIVKKENKTQEDIKTAEEMLSELTDALREFADTQIKG